METTLLEIENSLITGTYIQMSQQLVKDAYLEDGYISGGKYEDVQFENVVFVDVNIQATVFTGCNFINCKFLNCNFHFSKFENCNFVACAMDSCNFCITNSLNSNYLSCAFTNMEEKESRFDAQFYDCDFDPKTMELIKKEPLMNMTKFHNTSSLSLCRMAA